MVGASPIGIVALFFAMLIVLGFVCYLAARAGRAQEREIIAKREARLNQQQVEVANEQASIAENAPVDRTDANNRLRALRQRHISNR